MTRTGAARSTSVPSPSCPRSFLPQQYARPSTERPHACRSPTEISVNRRPPATGIGVRLQGVPLHESLEGAPSCPASFAPQQYAAPSAAIAQVEWDPAATAVNVSPPAAGCGAALLSSVAAAPSWPERFSPQHRISPDDVMPHACSPPAASCANRKESRTATGAAEDDSPSTPSRDAKFIPQQ